MRAYAPANRVIIGSSNDQVQNRWQPWLQGSLGQHGADRTQVGPMLAPWTLLYGKLLLEPILTYSLQTVTGVIDDTMILIISQIIFLPNGIW